MKASQPSAALVSVKVARALLGCDSLAVRTAVKDGRIAWVFNIACNPASRRRELRILTSLNGQGEGPRDLNGVLASILGRGRKRFRGREVEQLLLCSSVHVMELHNSGELSGEIVNHTRWITHASLADFLRRRRVA